MTPCYLKDGEMAVALTNRQTRICVGCDKAISIVSSDAQFLAKFEALSERYLPVLLTAVDLDRLIALARFGIGTERTMRTKDAKGVVVFFADDVERAEFVAMLEQVMSVECKLI